MKKGSSSLCQGCHSGFQRRKGFGGRRRDQAEQVQAAAKQEDGLPCPVLEQMPQSFPRKISVGQGVMVLDGAQG